ncbi:peptidoglycan-binding protein [Candidatus Poriferisocius sp.]|uniref:peptidoglycan-binding protein n=1 Tax=Candidatus Poriferisocius sp. TaxID=3101276 RepID=UPI003B01B1D1
MTVVTVLAGVGGWLAGRTLGSSDESSFASGDLQPSIITVPVKYQELESRVAVRGNVRTKGAKNINLVQGAGASILTKDILNVGSRVVEGNVVAEVTFRPVFVFQGELPMFRDFHLGLEGEDIRQLEEALTRIGYDVGAIDGVYDLSMEEAVEVFYSDAGYSMYEPSLEDREQIVRSQNQVDAAREQLRQAKSITSSTSNLEELGVSSRIAQFERNLEIAELMLTRNTSIYGSRVPKEEIIFVSELPRQVAQVFVNRGDIISEVYVALSGVEHIVESSISSTDISLIETGMSVMLDNQSDNSTYEGQITFLEDVPGTNDLPDNRYYMEISILGEDAGALSGNVRVVIPITSTNGKVLTVPFSALSISIDNIPQVQIESPEGEIITVKVETGLRAFGEVEIRPLDDVSIVEGTQVVVGMLDPTTY